MFKLQKGFAFAALTTVAMGMATLAGPLAASAANNQKVSSNNECPVAVIYAQGKGASNVFAKLHYDPATKAVKDGQLNFTDANYGRHSVTASSGQINENGMTLYGDDYQLAFDFNNTVSDTDIAACNVVEADGAATGKLYDPAQNEYDLSGGDIFINSPVPALR